MLRRRKVENEVESDLTIKHETVLGDAGESNELDRIVLGDTGGFTKNLKRELSHDSSDDEGPAEEKIIRSDDIEIPSIVKKEDVAAWSDDDDHSELKSHCNADLSKTTKFAHLTAYGNDQIEDGAHYSNRLRTHFQKSIGMPVPKWASSSKASKKRRKNFSDDESDEDDYDFTRRTGNYIGKSVHLPQETLQFKRICDVTASNKIKAVINSVEFHKQAKVLLVSGYTQCVMLFQIDGNENSLLHSIKFDGFPVETSHFSADGERIVVGSKLHSHFYYYDMHADTIVKIPRIRRLQQQRLGKFCVSPDNKVIAFHGSSGSIHLLSATSYDYIASLKMNGNVCATSFSTSGDYLYTFGDDGEVYIWDVNRRTCVQRFFDEGCIKGTTLAVSHDDKYIACGSNTGVVNLYETDTIFRTDRPSPLKTLMNLTTSINCLRFNGNGETLSLGSCYKDNALRMFHMSSRTTFQNFPNERERLKKVQCFDFSPNSGYFCCGNDRGQAYLYRLFHYDSY